MPREIADDELADRLTRLARDGGVRTILEIGSSSGAGSTAAFVRGAEANPSLPTIFCIEAVAERFAELRARYAGRAFVRPYNVSSVPPEGFAGEDEVRGFYRLLPSKLNTFPLERVLGWRVADLEYVSRAGIPLDGIELVKRDSGVERFDVVLIDGSEFTGRAELDAVYGATHIVLDDINSFKNHYNCQRLLADPAYALVGGNPRLRFGYAVFERVRSTS